MSFKRELEQIRESGKLTIFEIEVIDKNNEQDWIVCDIEEKDNKLVAFRVGLTKKEENSKFVAKSEIDIDPDFSLDEHLQGLYDQVIEDICNSELFDLYIEGC